MTCPHTKTVPPATKPAHSHKWLTTGFLSANIEPLWPRAPAKCTQDVVMATEIELIYIVIATGIGYCWIFVYITCARSKTKGY